MQTGPEIATEIDQLEKAGNDDFHLILTGGAWAYEVHELHHFLRRIRVQNAKHHRMQRELFLLAASLPVFLGLATLGVAWNRLTFTYFSLSLFILVIMVLLAGNYQLKHHYHYVSQSGKLRFLIQQELEIRRTDAQLF